jgi:hypothetical protein
VKQPPFHSKKNHNRMKESVLRDFNVKTESQLLMKLDKESQTIPCVSCGKEFSINHMRFVDGDPFCENCY